MQCPFLLQPGEAFYCEVLADRCGDWLRLCSSWVCRHAWEERCPRFRDVMREVDIPAQEFIDDRGCLHPSQIGHINRIGGVNAILTDLP